MPFDVKPKNPDVDQALLDQFAKGAETHAGAPVEIANPDLDRITESMLFRCSKRTIEDFSFVFEHTNVKSKQKLLESILLPAIQSMAEAIRAKQ